MATAVGVDRRRSRSRAAATASWTTSTRRCSSSRRLKTRRLTCSSAAATFRRAAAGLMAAWRAAPCRAMHGVPPGSASRARPYAHQVHNDAPAARPCHTNPSSPFFLLSPFPSFHASSLSSHPYPPEVTTGPSLLPLLPPPGAGCAQPRRSGDHGLPAQVPLHAELSQILLGRGRGAHHHAVQWVASKGGAGNGVGGWVDWLHVRM